MTDDDGTMRSFDRRRMVPVVVVAILGVLGGYAVGFARGSAGLDQGSSPTTSVVTPVPGGAPTPSATPTTSEAVATPTPSTTIDLTDGLPTDADGATIDVRGDWSTEDSVASPSADPAWPAGSDLPPTADDGPAITITAPGTLEVVSARLVTATAHAGVGLAGDGSSWQLNVGPELDRLLLYEVVDGTPEQRAFLVTPVIDGTTIGMFASEGRIGVLVDGQPRAVDGFFGVELDVDAAGFAPTVATIIAGSDGSAFADLMYG